MLCLYCDMFTCFHVQKGLYFSHVLQNLFSVCGRDTLGGNFGIEPFAEHLQAQIPTLESRENPKKHNSAH